jgi:Domain of unknown function (DUF397)
VGSVSSTDKQDLSWRRSSACASGDCVEVAYRENRVYIRNSRAAGIILEVNRPQWVEFLATLMSKGANYPNGIADLDTQSSQDSPKAPR